MAGASGKENLTKEDAALVVAGHDLPRGNLARHALTTGPLRRMVERAASKTPEIEVALDGLQ